MTERLLITGTDTGVGKTHVTALLARHLLAQGMSFGIYKPVCSGGREVAGDIRWDDIERLSAASGGKFPRERMCPQRFLAPLAPPLAAEAENRGVDEALLVSGADWWDGRVDRLLIEGVGGWLCPVSQSMTVADLAVRWQAETLIVAANRLGVINHTLLTVESIRRKGLPVRGVVLNEVMEEEATDDFTAGNVSEISKHGDVIVFGVAPFDSAPEGNRRPVAFPVDWNRVLKLS
jgi:dethiobiotin synthetase